MWHHLFVPLDGSAVAEAALPYAAALARMMDADLTLARVAEPVFGPGLWMVEAIPSAQATVDAEDYLGSIKARPALAGLKVKTMVGDGPVASALLDLLHQSGADLTVLTTHGHGGVVRMLLGDVADKIVRHAGTPVLVIRPPEHQPMREAVSFQRIGVTLDGSAFAEQALPMARTLALASGAGLDLIRVPTVPAYATVAPETAGWIPELLAEMTAEATAYLADKAAELTADGLKVHTHVETVVAGPAAGGICRYAEQVGLDVLMMTTHGRGGLSRWVMGSVADQVLRQSHTPVWVLRASEDEDDDD